MPNQSGVWTLSQQFQARGQGLWPAPPGAPTIGTASVVSATSASVTFTAPTCTGYPAGVTGYLVTSSPGCITATGASSPVTVTGLTACSTYTFKVKAQNSSGLYGACSAASNSIKMAVIGQQAYTSAGTYSWVAPSGVTSVSVVAIGSGGRSGAGLGYKNNYSVTPGASYTVQVGASVSGSTGQDSFFVSKCVVKGGGGCGGAGGTYTGDGGGNGGQGACSFIFGGGGAGGYSGNGGSGGCRFCGPGNPGSGGGGGGGQGGTSPSGVFYGGGGGGVGILGQGASGTGGTKSGTTLFGGTGGSCGNGGTAGGFICFGCCGTVTFSGAGGNYGGGRGGNSGGSGGGAVRIIWPGSTRKFPSTCTGNK